MIHIRNLQDLSTIQDDPELYREVASTILYCQYEMLEDEDDIDDHNFNLFILNDQEKAYIMDLGEPEETVITRIECCGEIRTFCRLVYPVEIILYEEHEVPNQ